MAWMGNSAAVSSNAPAASTMRCMQRTICICSSECPALHYLRSVHDGCGGALQYNPTCDMATTINTFNDKDPGGTRSVNAGSSSQNACRGCVWYDSCWSRSATMDQLGRGVQPGKRICPARACDCSRLQGPRASSTVSSTCLRMSWLLPAAFRTVCGMPSRLPLPQSIGVHIRKCISMPAQLSMFIRAQSSILIG